MQVTLQLCEESVLFNYCLCFSDFRVGPQHRRGWETKISSLLTRFPRWVRLGQKQRKLNCQMPTGGMWRIGNLLVSAVFCNVRLRKPPGGWYWHLPFPGNRSGPKTWKHLQGQSGIEQFSSQKIPLPGLGLDKVAILYQGQRAGEDSLWLGFQFHLILALSFCGYHQPWPGMRKRPLLVFPLTVLHKDAQ